MNAPNDTQIGNSMLQAFRQNLADRLTQIGIDAIKPKIRQAAEETVRELESEWKSHHSMFPDPQVIIQLIIKETTVVKS